MCVCVPVCVSPWFAGYSCFLGDSQVSDTNPEAVGFGLIDKDIRGGIMSEQAFE